MRTRGRKIDTFEYKIEGVPFAIPVRIHKREYEPTQFTVDWENDDSSIRISMENVDIDELRTEVEEVLKDKVSVTWEEYMHLRFDGSFHPEFDDEDYDEDVKTGTDCSSHISWELVLIGTSQDGKKYHRSHGQWDYQREIKHGLPDTGNKLNYRDEPTGAVLALLPKTEANVQAIEAIRRAYAQLNKKLSDLVLSEGLEEELQKIAKTGLLPAPE